MGRRTAGKSEFKQRHPYCCYCGGQNKTETVDHVPSTQFFEERKAPYAIWAPACSGCKNTGGGSEQVVAFLARADPRREHTVYGAELMSRFVRSNPRLANAILPSPSSKRSAARKYGSTAVLDLGDPEIDYHFQVVGAKWALALYYVETGTILPSDGVVWVRWWTNANRLDGPILPPEIQAVLPANGRALRQGKVSSVGQFEFNVEKIPDTDIVVSFISCGFAFAICMITSPDPNLFNEAESDGALIHRPSQPLEPPKVLYSGPYRFTQSNSDRHATQHSPDRAPA
jgi:hypothetical protein